MWAPHLVGATGFYAIEPNPSTAIASLDTGWKMPAHATTPPS
jgi:hypothetical protein